MDQDDRKSRSGAPPLYLDLVRRYTAARLRAAYTYLDPEPLPEKHVDLLLRLRQRERERSAHEA